MEWNELSPWAKLLKSRKFWLLILDTVVSIVLFVAGAYFPQAQETVKFMIVTMQPIFIFLIMAIAWEDAANAHQ